MRLLALLLISALSLASSSAFAATLNVVGGQLMGASNVLVDGNLYDVQFLDGTCIDLYNGCIDVSDFTFQTEASAALASLALVEQVFFDGPEGLFDSSPSLTNGCLPLALGGTCDVFTVFAIHDGMGGAGLAPYYMSFAEVLLAPEFSSQVSTANAGNVYMYNYSHIDYWFAPATFAVWSPVPEPSTALLMGLGLAGLAARRR